MPTGSVDAQLLGSWQNFYMIVGTAAATLTGLMFVAITLLAGIESHITTLNAALATYHTPTILHFCAVLLMASLLSVPWPSITYPLVVLGLLSAGMVVYLAFVMRRMGHIPIPNYHPPLGDWLWYAVMPLGAHIVILIALVIFPVNWTLYCIAAAMLALLFIGLRNAWDLVSFLAVERQHAEGRSEK